MGCAVDGAEVEKQEITGREASKNSAIPKGRFFL